MAKRKDPAVAVLRYFETADIGQARLILALARDAVARRSGPERAPRTQAATPVGGSSEPQVAKPRSRRATGVPVDVVPPPPGGTPPPARPAGAGLGPLPGA
jgi:hypothetical protein